MNPIFFMGNICLMLLSFKAMHFETFFFHKEYNRQMAV